VHNNTGPLGKPVITGRSYFTANKLDVYFHLHLRVFVLGGVTVAVFTELLPSLVKVSVYCQLRPCDPLFHQLYYIRD